MIIYHISNLEMNRWKISAGEMEFHLKQNGIFQPVILKGFERHNSYSLNKWKSLLAEI